MISETPHISQIEDKTVENILNYFEWPSPDEPGYDYYHQLIFLGAYRLRQNGITNAVYYSGYGNSTLWTLPGGGTLGVWSDGTIA